MFLLTSMVFYLERYGAEGANGAVTLGDNYNTAESLIVLLLGLSFVLVGL